MPFSLNKKEGVHKPQNVGSPLMRVRASKTLILRASRGAQGPADTFIVAHRDLCRICHLQNQKVTSLWYFAPWTSVSNLPFLD